MRARAAAGRGGGGAGDRLRSSLNRWRRRWSRRALTRRVHSRKSHALSKPSHLVRFQKRPPADHEQAPPRRERRNGGPVLTPAIRARPAAAAAVRARARAAKASSLTRRSKAALAKRQDSINILRSNSTGSGGIGSGVPASGLGIVNTGSDGVVDMAALVDQLTHDLALAMETAFAYRAITFALETEAARDQLLQTIERVASVESALQQQESDAAKARGTELFLTVREPEPEPEPERVSVWDGAAACPGARLYMRLTGRFARCRLLPAGAPGRRVLVGAVSGASCRAAPRQTCGRPWPSC